MGYNKENKKTSDSQPSRRNVKIWCQVEPFVGRLLRVETDTNCMTYGTIVKY